MASLSVVKSDKRALGGGEESRVWLEGGVAGGGIAACCCNFLLGEKRSRERTADEMRRKGGRNSCGRVRSENQQRL